MIISASRRTDIPAFYMEWFVRRLRAGFVLVPNPFNPHQVQRVSLLPEDVDAIVFWTKNPAPLLPHLDEITRAGIPVFVHQTITAYPSMVEPGSPGRAEATRLFRELSRRVGASRLVWRYDPLFFGKGWEESSHLEAIERIAAELAGSTGRLMLGFLRQYRKTIRNLRRVLDGEEMASLSTRPCALTTERFLREVEVRAAASGMEVRVCAADEDLICAGALPGACIDAEMLRVHGVTVLPIRDPGQRAACRCVPSRDIGMYDSCGNGCVYCYANRSPEIGARNLQLHHHPDEASLLGLHR
ncbi:MAG: DUF1848 domain-containing protein [Gaiellales bacterium]|nr:DUF1848 domain-containing protein [Gaiellales bacterium]